ncbi:sensor histidine kinase [Massilia sp. 9I]|uniref:sensor histidine kinase n=1 Tax=Massilia sp. 9I TaxID=2653152 RepID=UPI0012F16B39|nr:ATP-binding protein [Massilia sp. 9I]VXC58944.1 conserved hypothetical protein [Massilia sp. 9I]
MHAQPSGPSRKKTGPSHASAGPEGFLTDEQASAMRRLMDEQVLVNQALAVRVFAYERATEALQKAKSRLQELMARERAAHEAERKRLSRALRGSLSQNLLAIRFDIAALHRQTRERHPRLHATAGVALDNLDHTLRLVRELLDGLWPAGLDLGLQGAIEIEVAKFRHASGLTCVFQGEISGNTPLPEEAALTVFRVLQECLANVLHHAMASRVLVRIHQASDRLVMVVADNGIGFDPGSARAPDCLGLLHMEEHATAARGTLKIMSVPDQGTEIHLWLPVNMPPASPIG